MHAKEGPLESIGSWYEHRLVPANDTGWNASGVPLITLPQGPSVVLAAFPACEGPREGGFLGQATNPIHHIQKGFGNAADELERYVIDETRCLVIISGILAVHKSTEELAALPAALQPDPREAIKAIITKRLEEIGISRDQLELRDLGPEKHLAYLSLYYAGSVRFGLKAATEKSSDKALIAA